jgi:hypothetical protein
LEYEFAPRRHGRRRPTIHEFLFYFGGLRIRKQKKNVDGRPSPTMTAGGMKFKPYSRGLDQGELV